MSRCKVAIIGGGASGLSCAISLKNMLPESKVTIYEKLSVAGKKILATGNGRCNLSNTNISPKYYDGDRKIINLILKNFDNSDCISFFNEIGLKTTTEDGRTYPLTMNSASVNYVLLQACNKLGINILTNSEVTSAKKTDLGFEISTASEEISEYDYCILALGGKAAPMHGTDGYGYKLLKNFGVKYDPITPALVQLRTVNSQYTGQEILKGVRVHGSIALYESDEGIFTNTPLTSESGELLFTDYGISGIPAMQISGKVAQLIYDNVDSLPKIVIDLVPSLSEEQIAKYITSRISENPHLSPNTALYGILNEKVAMVVCNDNENNKCIAHRIKNFTLTVSGTNGFKDAQVTHGGVSSSSLRTASLEAKDVDGLFICGELLNVDGTCGGYNLHFAWGSGIHVAKEVANLAKNK